VERTESLRDLFDDIAMDDQRSMSVRRLSGRARVRET